MIAAIKRLRSSIGSAQRTLRGGGAPRCSGIGSAVLKRQGVDRVQLFYKKIGLILNLPKPNHI
jgi:hypothetical protein